ncbi:class I adenylate-forming enzyme family protein [Actinocorallia longicatena]|uniref:Class I adenylate-forming enzyme family protein n=1 Tax=Actinocorallia longicatena TaxID=111803 RepID=A0ABP6Q7B8_9ACTN
MNTRGLHPAERVAEYTAKGWWSEETMDGLFRARVAAEPDREALVDPADKQDLVGSPPRRLTWAQVDDEVTALADVLLAHGVEAGDVVGLQLPNTVELVTAYLALWRIGAVVSPLAVQYREHEVGELGRLAEFTAFVTASRFGDRDLAADVRRALPELDTVFAYGPSGDVEIGGPAAPGARERVEAHVAEHPADPNDCVTICWTSGTESTPKGVPRTHYDWLAMSWATVDAPRLTRDDVLLNPFPMVNMAGINGMFLPWLRVGGLLVQHHPFNLPVFLQQIAAEQATYTVAPPALLSMLLARPDLLAATGIGSLRLIGSGSAPLPPAMVRGWQEEHGIGIINFFGSNEGIGLMTDPHDVPDPEERARYFPRYGTPGVTWTSRLSEQINVKLVDADGREVTEPGVPGELRLKGPVVFPGYLGGDLLPSPFDEDGYLKTGDVFVIAGADDRFLHYVDRAKDLVIRGGMNIAPAEIEGLLAAHPGVADVAVVGYPDEILGERVCAVVVPAEGAAPELADLVAFLRERKIASYKLPERLELREVLPRNPVGKILKREVRADVLAGKESA